MNNFKSFISSVAIAFVASSVLVVSAQADSADMAEGEIRKVDKGTQKITIKHGEIKSLDMPGMTMLFRVKDAAVLDTVKPGDKVKFKAEKLGSAFVVTELQIVK